MLTKDEKRKNPATGRDIQLKKGDIVQHSIVDSDLWWRVIQTADTVTEGNRDCRPASAYAKTMQKDNNTWGDASVDLYPEPLRAEIDAINEWVYDDLNNGVYKAGFARSQEAYDEAFDGVLLLE